MLNHIPNKTDKDKLLKEGDTKCYFSSADAWKSRKTSAMKVVPYKEQKRNEWIIEL